VAELNDMNLYDRIPNNVNLSEDKKLQRALEKWLPNYLDWWREMGPDGFQEKDVWLRTAVDVGSEGWAHFDYVKMPDYRWGIFLEPPKPDAIVGFGDNYGRPAYQEVPGEFRNSLRRIIVTQGDTEPASVEQQRQLGKTCPSLYDMRNLFQVNVEEGRHLWAMVYLLHGYFGRDGRDEADALLERRSGNPDKPRILRVHDVYRSRWQVSAFRARRIRFRTTRTHVPVHAHGRSASHVRRRHGPRPRGATHGAVDEGR
jgi:benzoyl-CoA 2,3-dioxygenase component B